MNKNTTGRKQSRGEETKLKILQATLTIIRDQGMRVVRHRAVADEASVPLGSTTYHFKDIEDLISSAFEYWYSQYAMGRNPLFITIEQEVAELAQEGLEQQELLDLLKQKAAEYLTDSVISSREQRSIEFAFHDEAMRNPKLKGLLNDSQQQDLQRVEQLFILLGSNSPVLDAEVLLNTMLQIERSVLLHEDQNSEDVLQHYIKVLQRQMQAIFTLLPK